MARPAGPPVLGHKTFAGFAPPEDSRLAIRVSEDLALMGVTVPFGPGQATPFEVSPVGDAMVRLLRDGAVLHEAPGDTLLGIPLPEPGGYRVEIDLGVDLFPTGGVAYGPWLSSKPAYVRG